jgi:hypothetical protein
VVVAHVISLSPFSKTSPTLAWQAIAAQAAHEAKEAVASLEPQLKAITHEAIIRKGDIWQELSAKNTRHVSISFTLPAAMLVTSPNSL